jgi:hypothetical protein
VTDAAMLEDRIFIPLALSHDPAAVVSADWIALASLWEAPTIVSVTAENGQILQQKLNRVMNDFHPWFCADTPNTEETTAMLFSSSKKETH